MPNSTEIRQILVNAICSVNDTGGSAEDLGFKHTVLGKFKNYNLHMTNSLETRQTEIVSQNHSKTFFEDQRKVISTQPVTSDSTKQVFNIDVPTGYKVTTGSVSFKVNGLEQQTTTDQKTAEVSSSDFYLSGSRFEQLVLYKPRADHSGLEVDNDDSLILKYRMEKVSG